MVSQIFETNLCHLLDLGEKKSSRPGDSATKQTQSISQQPSDRTNQRVGSNQKQLKELTRTIIAPQKQNLIFSMQNLKESSGTPTANLRKFVNQDTKTIVGAGIENDYVSNAQTTINKQTSSSFAREMATFDTFGRPSAMSHEKRKDSSSMLEQSPIVKEVERLDTQNTHEQTSIRKQSKKKKK